MEDIFDTLQRRQLDTPRGPVVYWVSRCSSPRTLVLLHGLFGDHSIFAPLIARFLGRYNLLCWDAPAQGQSRPCTVHTYCYDALDLHAILKQESLPGPVLLGHSFGGAVAQVYLRLFSADGFLAVDTLPFGVQYYQGFELWKLWQCQWFCHWFSSAHVRRRIAFLFSGTDQGREKLTEILRGYRREELFRILTTGYSGFFKENRDQTIPCPIRILVGRQERLTALLRHNRQWAENLGLSIQMIPQAGQLSVYENPEAVGDLAEAFLKDLEG